MIPHWLFYLIFGWMVFDALTEAPPEPPKVEVQDVGNADDEPGRANAKAKRPR